ncbi:Crp/Fnr family transcriptional regulator [Pedobacter frigiditerrae]|uniref:Crp/Fnr family transcriptional regulator n=1 Tax=Pedobacter frigiditerrae TaxID=2530452 RepID=A0A4R0MP86_9SPHI|nr:Crp/Fnr family transcriptional regulator [Pedobacter frigiditerrae]TCC88638.1 Crp/Fnr family transcriptional regulator [Pedobacter frigiditerrae]
METTNDTNYLLQVLGSITPLPAPFQERITEQTLTETFKAKEILLHPGETARRIYFVKEGFLRAYFLDQNGHEHTTWFVSAGDLMISVYSFFSQRPAEEYIEVLQEATLQSLTWHQLQSYYADFREGNLIGRIMTERYYILSEERSIFLRTQSPEQRYQALLQRHPNIEQLTTIQNIASHLSMTRETLSRLRSKLLRSNQQSQKTSQKTTP